MPAAVMAQTRAAQKAFKKGQEAQQARDYKTAVGFFEKAVAEDSTFASAWLQLAGFYKLNGDEQREYEAASAYLRHAQHSEPNYLRVLIPTAKKSIRYGGFENFRPQLQALTNNAYAPAAAVNDAADLLRRADLAKQVPSYGVELKEMPRTINFLPLQYFPSLTADDQLIVFTGRQSMAQNADENIFISRMNGSSWTIPKALSENINSSLNEGTAQISADGKTIVFASCQPGQGCDIYLSRYSGGRWETPLPIGDVNTKYWDSQPCVSADGRTIYFVSDRPGGFGGTDIWRSTMASSGRWSKPENLGETINTSENEYSPFIHPNLRSLFFASAGHPGLGGQDLFVSHLDNGNRWGAPQNLGQPINTPHNEPSIFVNAQGQTGYISRESGRGNQLASKIYSFTVPKEWNLPGVNLVLKGKIFGNGNNQPLAANLDLVNLETGQQVYSFRNDDQTGEYLIVLAEGREFGLFARPENNEYLPGSIYFNLTGADSLAFGKTIDIALSKRTKGSTARLNTVYFATGKYDLPKQALPELNNLAEYLKANPALRVEIGGHTDDVGGDAANQQLSQQRAASIVTYLQGKGIGKERISARGYGKTQPARPNSNDANRAFNRRIEAKVL